MLPDWKRPDLLDLVSQVHQLLWQDKHVQNVKLTASGALPYLVTHAGQSVYDLDSDIWLPNKVLKARLNTTDYGRTAPVDEFEFQDENYIEVSARCYPARPGTAAQVIFASDPGETTTRYFLYAWSKAGSILSENTQLKIPEEYHLTILIPAVLKMADGLEYGRYDDAIEAVKFYKNELKCFLNQVTTTRSYNTPPREF